MKAADLVGIVAMGITIAVIGFASARLIDDSGIDTIGTILVLVGAGISALGLLALAVYAGVKAGRTE